MYKYLLKSDSISRFHVLFIEDSIFKYILPIFLVVSYEQNNLVVEFSKSVFWKFHKY